MESLPGRLPWFHVCRQLLGRFVPSGYALGGLSAWTMVCGVVIWRWACFVGGRPVTERLRSALCAALAAATAVEVSLCLLGFLRWWMVLVFLVLNAWGPLDAVLRYPVMHDVDTFFAMKQLLLLCAKLVSLSFGFVDLLSSMPLLLALSMLDFFVLPALYLMALPLDQSPEEQRRAARNVLDVDILLRAARAARDPSRRDLWLRRLRRCALDAHSVIVPAKLRGLPLWEQEGVRGGAQRRSARHCAGGC
eukprot:TRINITY_DN19772_c0_g1_i1.p1 TRINITY_DN19772_c0_g1~~TRINITY_DN19772_c0_g1_i1.p1  ORF type:complete len:249 (+),score=40.60 TRINITY_DN19772_c0_g1_i1:98-844(+)